MTSPDECLIFFGILTVVILLATVFYYYPVDNGHLVDRDHCPSCGKLEGGERTGDELIGIFQKKENVRTMYGWDGNSSRLAWYEKYKVHYKCKYCNHQWTSYKIMRQ